MASAARPTHGSRPPPALRRPPALRVGVAPAAIRRARSAKVSPSWVRAHHPPQLGRDRRRRTGHTASTAVATVRAAAQLGRDRLERPGNAGGEPPVGRATAARRPPPAPRRRRDQHAGRPRMRAQSAAATIAAAATHADGPRARPPASGVDANVGIGRAPVASGIAHAGGQLASRDRGAERPRPGRRGGVGGRRRCSAPRTTSGPATRDQDDVSSPGQTSGQSTDRPRHARRSDDVAARRESTSARRASEQRPGAGPRATADDLGDLLDHGGAPSRRRATNTTASMLAPICWRHRGRAAALIAPSSTSVSSRRSASRGTVRVDGATAIRRDRCSAPGACRAPRRRGPRRRRAVGPHPQRGAHQIAHA